MHTLYNVETQIPVFFRITEASVHDSKAMIEIPYEPGSYYIFDRGYNNFKMLYKIHQKQYYLEPLRLVKYRDEEQEREFTFITNATHISALQVAELYKNRWQVELFFKWLKQHLKIKKF